MGGTCTGKHGIGQGKQKYLKAEPGPEAIDAMRALNQALDPQNIFIPGKILPAVQACTFRTASVTCRAATLAAKTSSWRPRCSTNRNLTRLTIPGLAVEWCGEFVTIDKNWSGLAAGLVQ